MTYITLNECIKRLDQPPVALKHDKATGWRVTPWSFRAATVGEICAAVNLLDPEANRVVATINNLFRAGNFFTHEREKHQEALSDLRSVSKKIASYGIKNQSLLFDIALKAAEDHGWEVAENIKNFGIVDEEMLYQVALKVAKLSGWGVSKYIQNFGIKDEERLFQIALKDGSQYGKGVSEYIQNYGIKDKEKLYRIALNATSTNRLGVAVSYYIKNYGIEDEEKLYQIALNDAAQRGQGVSFSIQNYGFKDDEKRYQIALVAAAQSGVGVSEYIQNYGIKDEEKLYRIALKAAAQNGEGASEFIQKYGFKDEEKLFQIALIARAAKYIQNYGIKDEEKLYQIALKAAPSEYIQNYGLKDEEKLYQIALKAVSSEHIQKYGLKDEKKLFQVALKAAAQNGLEVSKYIQNYGITDEEKLYQIALTAAANDGEGVSLHIASYRLENHEMLYRIALRAILQDAERSAYSLDNYGWESDRLKWYAHSLINPSASYQYIFLFLVLDWRKKELPPFLVAENPDPFVQHKLRKWIVELLNLEITNEQIEQEQPLFTQLMQLRNPALRSQITAYLPEVYKKAQAWEALKSIPLKVPKKDYSLLARLLHLGHGPITLSAFYSQLEDPFDQELYLQFLLRIKETHLLNQLATQPNRKAMLHFMKTATDIVSFGHPELLTGDLDKQLEHLFLTELQGLKVPNFKEAYGNTLNKFRKKELIFTYLSSLRGPVAKAYFKDIIEFILNGTFFDKRYDIPHLKMIFAKFPIENEWRKGETASDLLTGPVDAGVQIPISLADMRAKIITDGHLKISEGSPLYRCLMGENREECLKELQNEIHTEDFKIQIKCLQLLDSRLTEKNKEKYLSELDQLCNGTQFQIDVRGWQALMRPATSRSDYRVSDTDDPNHLFLLGEEVSGSCQRITAGSALNKGLLGYMLNGYNRAVVVTDKNGAIVARCLLRLYWDGEKPVLYQERFYTRSNDPKLKHLVDAMCLRRAKALNIPLVNGNEEGKRYPKTLQITGGRVDIEYVDAIGGIQKSHYKVPYSFIANATY